MSTYQVEESAIIEAPAAAIYELIADYQEGHPAILPARYFTELQVIEGGIGAGTVLSAKMNVLGTVTTFMFTVTEPEPGRILREEDASAGVVTTFTVDPADDGHQTRVTIATTATTSKGGLIGWMEKLVTTSVLRRIYREELAQLAIIARRRSEKNYLDSAAG